MRFLGLVVVTLVVGLMTAGCGGTPSTQGGSSGGGSNASKSSDAKACDLLTADLVQSVLGKPVKPASTNENAPITNGDTTVSQCNYLAQSEAADAPQASLLVRHSSPEQAKQAFDGSKSTYHGQDVPGLGDAAYRTTTPAQLHVLKDGNWLIISAGTFRKPDPAAQEKLARAILDKL
jgi:hypothetical protein